MRDIDQYKKGLEEAGLPAYIKQKFPFNHDFLKKASDDELKAALMELQRAKEEQKVVSQTCGMIKCVNADAQKRDKFELENVKCEWMMKKDRNKELREALALAETGEKVLNSVLSYRPLDEIANHALNAEWQRAEDERDFATWQCNELMIKGTQQKLRLNIQRAVVGAQLKNAGDYEAAVNLIKTNGFKQQAEKTEEIMKVVAAMWKCQQEQPAGRLMMAPASRLTPDWKTYIVRFASMMVSMERFQDETKQLKWSKSLKFDFAVEKSGAKNQ